MIFLTVLLTLIASMIGTIGGFGVSTIMVPLLIPFFGLLKTLLFVGIVHLFTDIWKIILFRKGIKLKLALMFGVPGIIFSFLGARLLVQIPVDILSKGVGLLLIAYVVLFFIKPRIKLKEKFSTSIIGGIIYGFTAGISGVGGPERSAFLSAYKLPKSAFIATSGVIGILIDFSRLTTYHFEGIRLNSQELLNLGLLIPVSFVGAFLGRWLVEEIPEIRFRTLVALLILAIGIKLAIGF